MTTETLTRASLSYSSRNAATSARRSPRPRPAGPLRRAAARARGSSSTRRSARRRARRRPRARAARSARRRRARAGRARRSPPAACRRRAPPGPTSGRPSQRDGITTTSAAPISARASGRTPRKRTRSATPVSAASRSSSGRSGPSPAIASVASGHLRQRGDRERVVLLLDEPPDGEHEPRPGLEPELGRAVGRGRGGPDARSTTVASGGRPCCSSAAATPGPHATGGRPEGAAGAPFRGQSCSGTPWTLTSPGGRRPRRVARPVASAMSGCARARRPAASRGRPGEPRCRGRNAPRPPLHERQRERLRVKLAPRAVPARRRRRPRGRPRARPGRPRARTRSAPPVPSSWITWRMRTAPRRARPSCPATAVGREVLGAPVAAPLAPESAAPFGVAGELRPARRPAARGLSGSTSKPVSPSTTSSGIPPTRVATTGRPAAIASRTPSGKLSAREGWTRTSSSGSRSRTSATKPWKRASTPAACACRSSPVAQRAVAVELESQRCLHQPRRLEQDVDPLPVLEVRRDPGDEPSSRAARTVLGPTSTRSGMTWTQPPRETVGEQEVRHRLRGRDHVPEPRQPGLDRQVAVLSQASRPRETPGGSGASGGRSSPRSPPASRAGYGATRAPRSRPASRPNRPARRSWVWTTSAPRSFRQQRRRRRAHRACGRPGRPRRALQRAEALGDRLAGAEHVTSTPCAATRGASCRGA